MLDPNFFQRINALQNYQNQQSNQANLQQLKANQSELAGLRRQLAKEANKPQCPHCGGPTEKGYDACKNCGRDVIWYGQFVGKPGEEYRIQQLHDIWALDQQKQHKRYEREKKTQEQRKQLFHRIYFCIWWAAVLVGCVWGAYWYFVMKDAPLRTYNQAELRELRELENDDNVD